VDLSDAIAKREAQIKDRAARRFAARNAEAAAWKAKRDAEIAAARPTTIAEAVDRHYAEEFASAGAPPAGTPGADATRVDDEGAS
jgi:hypothetical protein